MLWFWGLQFLFPEWWERNIVGDDPDDVDDE